jgi:hypothetical protein
MATAHKTPGVYISEPDSFPPSIVGVETAVPAFIGYTERASDRSRDLRLAPVRISSMADYIAKFGHGFRETYYLVTENTDVAARDYVIGTVRLREGADPLKLVESGLSNFNLYSSLRLFYDNGGGDCYIVSCGTFVDPDTNEAVTVEADNLIAGIDAIANEVGPTMLCVPDAVLLQNAARYDALVVRMLRQCLDKQDRVALIDVWGTYDIPETATAPVKEATERDPGPFTAEGRIERLRNGLAGAPPESLRYGIAYFPNLKTSVVSTADISIDNFARGGERGKRLVSALTDVVGRLYPEEEGRENPRARKILDNYVNRIATEDDPKPATPAAAAAEPAITSSELTKGLLANLPPLRDLFQLIADSQNTLPPSGAMAGVFSQIDTTRGVWNAPANVGIAGLIAPSLAITDRDQENMNVPAEGMAVNAIRTFPGRGSLVWGARTLDSTSNDWKYIQVRRTMIYVEQSVKTALNAFVFAPNTAQTWTTVTSAIESFLHGLWSAGGLMGATPAEAYGVRCGLGSTMTPDDILNGNMIVHVVLQMVRPAEFIELVFKQQMLGDS